MRCDEFEVRLNAALDERRPSWWDRELWQHWESCHYCRQVADSYATMLEGFHGLDIPPVPEDVASRVLAEFPVESPPVRRWSLAAAMVATAAGVLLALFPLMRAPKDARPKNAVAIGQAKPQAVTVNQAVATTGWEQLPLVGRFWTGKRRTDEYRNLAKETGQGLAVVYLYTPGITGSVRSDYSEPAWAAPMSESFKPVADSMAQTFGGIMRALPVADLAAAR